ncbi:MAG: saccharopine dehydrogenase [Paracoccaceae bacterium]|nr:saccharopine dehydrogenase [Paracoccaceae bacterium]MDG1739664.1 saccharopine dehydrogenase [Paracoccaceae bacterium]MDG2257181.1 saccharopine dehydrogenase [Paracoccaceae bacterium]
MTHLWVRAEQRLHEERVGLTPEGAKALLDAGIRVTVEDSSVRAIGIEGYKNAGVEIAPENTWTSAPQDAIIFGLKELPEDGTPLIHRHIMFGHAFKGQHSGKELLRRFNAGGGTLYDLEYLVGDDGRRVAAFGYWAGFAGAAVAMRCWAAQARNEEAGPVSVFHSSRAMLNDLVEDLQASGASIPTAIVIGALGRVGTGASELLDAVGVPVTQWDMEETSSGGPFPEILAHDVFINCIFARPGTSVFVPKAALNGERNLSVIGDVSCDPDSDYNPVPVYDRATDWTVPALRVHDDPVMDVTAIDNLPSMLPVESSEDYALQLLPTLLTLNDLNAGVWTRALNDFKTHSEKV